MISGVERFSQTALPLIETMMLCLANRSTQRTALFVCLVFALLALPLAGTLHCEAAHAAERAPVPLTEACCVFLCLTVLIGLLTMLHHRLSIQHSLRDLKPVRLTYHSVRWVPPPRPIDLLL